MGILYAPKNGTILICDYTGQAPEMIKRRPVVMLSSVSPGLAIVVPLSTTDPRLIKPWHYFFKLPEPLPYPYDSESCWAKGDMVAHVSFGRLNMPFTGKDKNGKRIYQINQVNNIDLKAIIDAVSSALLGLG